MDGRSQTSGNRAENSIVFWVVILITSGLGSTQPPPEEWSPLWNRCHSILKLQATGPCTDHQVTACEGKKDNDNISTRPGYYCDERTRMCPSPPQSLDVQVFHHKPFTTKSNSYIGLNVSWGVQQTGNDSDFLTKHFELRAELFSTGIFISHITVNFTADDYINGVATVHYDCIYPIRSDVNTLINVVLKTLPHARGQYLHRDVNTIPREPDNTPEDESTVILPATDNTPEDESPMIFPATDNTPEDESTVNDVTGMSTFPILMGPAMAKESSEPWDTEFLLAIGVFGGLGLFCFFVFLARLARRWNKKSYCKKVLVVSQHDFNEKQSLLYKEMMVRLRETVGRVVDVLDLDADGDTPPYDVVYSELTSADQVIIIMSEELQQVLVRAQARYDVDLICESFDLVFLALFMLKQDMTISRLHEMKTLTVYVGDSTLDTHCDADLSYWESLPLQDGIGKLIGILQGHSPLKPRWAPDSAGTRPGPTDELQLSSLSTDSGFYNNDTSPVAPGQEIDDLSTVPVRLPFPEFGPSCKFLPPEPGRIHRSLYFHGNHAHRPTLNSNAQSLYPNAMNNSCVRRDGQIPHEGRTQLWSRPVFMPTTDMDSIAIEDDVSDINKSY